MYTQAMDLAPKEDRKVVRTAEEALLEERFSRLLQRVRRVQLGPDPVANMREHARAFLRFGQTNPTFYQLMARGPRDGQERKVRAAEDARAIMSGPLKWLTGYKMQLFLYAKATGAEIGTSNAWGGYDRAVS